MSGTEPWTIGRLLTWTQDYLKRQGSDSPRLDAEVLLAHVRGCERIQLYVAFDEVAAEPLRTAYRDLVKRRAEGEPVAYLVGRREFYSLSFRVTPAVLIPRPDTEYVVIEAVDYLSTLPGSSAPEVADVGTGSGCIAVAVAKHAPNSHVTAVDLSEPALEIARENVAAHALGDRIDCVAGDLLTGFPEKPRFDLILSNPPYVSESEFAACAPTVRNYEPRGALVSGPTGTEIIARLIGQSAARLQPGGWLVMEISPMIESSVRSLFAADEHFEPMVTRKDLSGQVRVAKARRRAT